MPVNFKFKFGDETRRCTFPDPPSWDSLSTRIQAVYGLPKETLAVSYLDAENDEITLSSEEELQDYYQLYSQTPDQVIKLNVLDLSSRRTGATSTPRVPLTIFELDDEWQRLPSFRPAPEVTMRCPDSESDVPHAFVEVVDNDTSTVVKEFQDAQTSRSSDGASTPQPALDKGKMRASPIPSRGTSTQSIVDDELPDKHEIHVLNRSASFDREPIEPQHEQPSTEGNGDRQDPTDPPLPDINQSHPSVSLTEDIAALLAAFSNAVTSHPELAVNLRRILDNARRGTYWEAHREVLTRSVNEISASVGATTEEFRRNAEAEAARRISDSLGGLFRSLSIDGPSSDAAGSSAEPSIGPFGPAAPRHPGGPVPPVFHHTPWNFFGGPMGPHPPPPPPPPHGPLHGPPPAPFPPNFVHPPPPPPPPFPVDDLIDTVTSSADPAPVAPHPYPLAPPKGPPRFGGSARRTSTGQAPDHNIWSPSSRPSWLPPPPPPIQDNPSQSSDDSQTKASSRELRASVETAKAHYKAEKERYRKEREERKRQREERKTSGPGAEAVPPSEFQESIQSQEPRASGFGHNLGRSTSLLVSNARGPFPRLEMVNVSVPPRRHHTINAGSSSDDANHRSYSRIVRKLSDMGFTDSSHPTLSAKVKSKLSSDVAVTKAEEDNIITIVMEELLVSRPRSNEPLRDQSGPSVPDQWH